MLSRWLGKKETAPEAGPMPARPDRVHAGPRVQAFRQSARQAVAAGTLPASAFRRLGDDTPPPTGGQIAPWIDKAIDRALALPVTATHYVVDHSLLTALSEHVEAEVDLDRLARHPDGFCMAFERMAVGIAACYAWYAADGERRNRRVVAETAILRGQPREQIARRFEFTPPARLDPVPLADIDTRDWIEDTLRGEAMMIGSGLVAPVDVARIACRSGLPATHARREGDPPTAITFPGHHADNLDTRPMDARAAHLATLTQDILLKRFDALPGFHQAFASVNTQVDWADLVARALRVERVRDVSGLATAPLDEEEMDLDDVVLRPDADGMGFTATLHVFGDRVCRLVGAGDGTMQADEWSEGCGTKDIEALDAYIAATGDPRNDGETPDSFAMRIVDIVSVYTMVEAYLQERVGFALFGIETPQGDVLHREPIPQGSTREEVVEAYRASAPRALSLDDLDDLAAAELWLSLTTTA